MSELTVRLDLYLPGGGSLGTNLPDEVADIDRINTNFKEIDESIGAPPVTSGTRPATPFDGRLAYETDTRRLVTYVESETAWAYSDEVPVFADAAARDAQFVTPMDNQRCRLANIDMEMVYDLAATKWKFTGNGLVPIMPTAVAGTGAVLNPDGSVTLTSGPNARLDGVFSAEFKSYKLVADIDGFASGSALVLRMCAAGVPITAANYQYAQVFSQAGSANGIQDNAATSIAVAPGSVAVMGSAEVLISSPFEAVRTLFNGTGLNRAASGPVAATVSGFHNLLTSYDGLQLLASGGVNMSGKFRIFGVR